MAAAIPVLLFGGWVAYLTASHERTNARTAAFEALDRVSTRLQSEILRQLEVVKALAGSASLDEPNLSMFHLEATRLRDSHPLWETVELTDPTGAQVVNILRPFGQQLGPTADLDSFRKVVERGTSVVGGLGPLGPVSGRRLITLRTPVYRDEKLRYVLSVHLVPDAVTTILREAGAPPGWIGVVLDGQGKIIARTLAEQFELGRPGSEAARAAVASAPSGSYVGKTLEGEEVEAVFRTLPDTGGWSVHLGLPTSSLNGPVTRSTFLLAGGGAVSLILGFGLAWLTARDIAQRRRDEEIRNKRALGASEERQGLAVEAAELGTFRWDFLTDQIIGSQRTGDLLRLPHDGKPNAVEQTWSSDTFLTSIDTADREHVESSVRQCLDSSSSVDIEFRSICADGSPRWVRAIAKCPTVDPDARNSVYGVLVDVHQKKVAEKERVELQRQLSAARENEQRRIARELHDQIGQTVTGLSLGLKGLEQHLSARGVSEPARDRLTWLQDLTSKIGRDIHQVALELRPSALDDLGLEKALSALTAEWSERFKLKVDLQIIGGPLQMSPESETAVYRIAQEAFTNAIKHAKATAISIVLERRANDFRLIVEDDGAGFDEDQITSKEDVHRIRLGLSGIRERLDLIDGTLYIESRPGSGTTLFISVPNTHPVPSA